MRETITLFDQATGAFTRVLTLPSHAIQRNTPKGFAFKRGRFDPLSQRVDLETGAIVDYQPPQPSSDHEWHENVSNGRPRWVKKAEVVERERRTAAALRDIDSLEKSQLRAMRELAIDPLNSGAKQRLMEIDAAIATRRKDI